MTNPSRLPVICDCCRAEGLAGEDPFEAFGALLDFEPVPRLKNRADGWDAEVQRAYIAALSLTGSKRQAARAVGKAAFGVDQLLKAQGSESFRAAHDEAMAMAADERGRRLAEGLRAVAAEQAGRRPAAPPWSRAASRAGPPASPDAPPDPEREEEKRREFLGRILRLYKIKLEQEREARLAGQISAADFYARQVTFIEAWADLLGTGLFRELTEWREGGFHLREIVQTPMSRLLDHVRREHFAKCGEPERPPPPAPDLLVDHGRFSTEPLEYCTSDSDRTMNEQLQDFAERHRRDAEAQVEWEAKARADAAAWRARIAGEETPSPSRGEGEAPPGAEGEGPEPGSS